jgi:hypothetical protein
MAMHARRRTTPAALALAAGLLVGLASAAGAQTGPAGPSFSRVSLPIAAVDGPLRFQARRGWAWTDADGASRLLLTGDVWMTLAGSSFRADRAAVWLRRVTDGPDTGAWQVYVDAENVRTPTGSPGLSVRADRLPVSGVVRATGPIAVRADLLTPEAPPAGEHGEFLTGAEAGLAETLRRSAGLPATTGQEDVPEIARRPIPDRAPPPPLPDRPARTAQTPAPAAPGQPAAPAPPPRQAPQGRPVFAASGTIAIAPGERATFVTGPEENALVLTGGVTLQYVDEQTQQTLDLTAQRVVVFLAAGPVADPGRFGVEQVRGIYLEGDVQASDGRYTLRGARVYYDLQRNRAVVIDAVFWTYDRLRRLPLYARADAIRQLSADQFSAQRATLSASSFFKPGFSLGMRDVTISRAPQAPGAPPARPDAGGAPPGLIADAVAPGVGAAGAQAPGRMLIDARGVTLRAGDVPVMFLPRYKGDPETFPLREVSASNSNETGFGVKTQWDLFHLLGISKPADLQTDLLADYYFDRGPALGTEMRWDRRRSAGSLFAYSVFDDRGTDLFKPGTEIERDGTTRGMIFGEHRQKIDEKWTAFFEGAYIGDPAFIDAYFERLGETRREFATQAFLTRRVDNELFTFQAKGVLNDFIANEWLLQSQGYNVTKLPEIGYALQSVDLFKSRPGLLQSWTEARLGRIGLNFDKPEASERGLTTPTLSERALGVQPNQSVAQRLRDRGFFEADVGRADLRQEFTSVLDAGPVRINPFLVGRFTAYDDDFDRYSPDENDNNRLWGSAGVRIGTTLNRVDDLASSRFFDVHRVRHVIEPSLTLWASATNVDRVDLPLYDDRVEGVSEGNAVRVALDQTWQTQRGAPGRWYSVDVLKLNLQYVLWGDDADRASPIGRWSPARPEDSQPGEFFAGDLVWQATDALALTSNVVFDLELNQQARTSAGALLQHSPQFSSFVEGRFINSQDSTYLDAGVQYAMSRRYNILFTGSYDVPNDRFQTVTAEVRRLSAGVLVAVAVGYNTITAETTLGFTLRPLGTGGDTNLRYPGFGALPPASVSDLRGVGTPW